MDKKLGSLKPEECPGAEDIRRPKPTYQTCPGCREEVEIWTDEVKTVCENCGQTVFKEDTPSCIEWCEHAKECVGSEKYRELVTHRKGGGRTKPTEILKEEHRVVERIFDVLEKASERLERGDKVKPEIFEKSVDFIRNFADRFHHGKEEDILFDWLEERGIPKDSGPVEVMLVEHEKGRAFVKGMLDATERYKEGDESAPAEIVANARGYIELLKEHIDKEDNILYPLADKAISEEDQEKLYKAFREVEEKLGGDTRERYTKLVESLEKEDGR